MREGFLRLDRARGAAIHHQRETAGGHRDNHLSPDWARIYLGGGGGGGRKKNQNEGGTGRVFTGSRGGFTTYRYVYTPENFGTTVC